ncbi:MocR-like pyridoxine biosynthesis transcription factor PdxR [Paenibacillus radicis (ex Gao et al. 2016)]|uniref:Transcriptional regulator n=1 Tax=Paenibacillus radicis (ex Gao et al. 2016) TaxID=1737354 RepID=A0A917GN27_9BACL|nr:PLP-dependent aminotransferase family protein [Paenibacillus radicis (ex Gao et al. 2016)]GGG51540.1 transcriptional regulator [Paenibacillus radicis (ex Gao et al. 2016)]
MEQLITAAYEKLAVAARAGTKTEALFLAVRDLIITGALHGSERLPSSRRLAEQLELSRGLVNQVYEMLVAEGFARTERGSGTFVAYVRPSLQHSASPSKAAIPLSSWAKRLRSEQLTTGSGEKAHSRAEIDFSSGQSDVSLFPWDDWRTLMFEQVRRLFEQERYEPSELEGSRSLREAIAQELRRERGIVASAGDIVITSGSMYAIALLSMLLIEPGSKVVVENPSYDGIRRAVEAAGGRPLYAAVDDYGIVPEPWDARLLFVTPSRQFPTGVALDPQRRKQLLEWASAHEAVIIEDDYDSEFRWGGRPSEPLKALDYEGRVVYVGTFSKTMFRELRLGYAVVPESLREPMRLAKHWLEPHSSGVAEQRALAAFMASGLYSRHLRRQRRLYGRRLLKFREEADRHLGGLFRFKPSDAGLHRYAEWTGAAADFERLRAACLQASVKWSSCEPYWIAETKNGIKASGGRLGALFTFAHLDEADIAEGLRRIGDCWRKLAETGE